MLILCFLQFFLYPQPGLSGQVKQLIEQPVENAISILQKTQIDKEDWRQLQEKLALELEGLESHVKQLNNAKEQHNKQISLAKTRLNLKRQQLADIQRIKVEMTPFLARVVERLEKLPEQGLPFLQKERRKRIARLNEILHDPDTSISEQYRKTMEALQIEAEFGITIETYQEKLAGDQQQKLVNILRLGRLGLYYVTLDASGCGFFNVAEDRWQLLPDRYIHPLQTAVAIASKRRPAEFVDMPLGRMVKS